MKEFEAGAAEIDKALEPEHGYSAQGVRSEIRQFVRASLTGDKAAEFVGQLGGLVETDKWFADAILEAPAVLSGLTPERYDTLRVSAQNAYASAALERVIAAKQVLTLDDKLASVANEPPRSFYDPNVEKGMATRVNAESLAE